jgi:PAS domain S-box-containing protein
MKPAGDFPEPEIRPSLILCRGPLTSTPSLFEPVPPLPETLLGSTISTREDLFSALLDLLQDVVLLVDATGTIVHANPSAVERFGGSAIPLEGSPAASRIIPPLSRDAFRGYLGGVLHDVSAAPLTVELPAMRGDGGEWKVSWRGRAVVSETGARGVLLVGRDVTEVQALRLREDRLKTPELERLAREEALARSEALFSGIVEVATDAIIAVDREHRMVIFNRGAETIFGYEASEALGAPLDMLLPPEAHKAHRAHVDGFAVSEVQARRMATRRQIEGVRKNGVRFPAEASILKVQVAEETLLTVVLRDISDRVRQQRGQELLARVGEILIPSLDLDATLQAVSEVAIERLADFCILDLVEEDGEVRRVMALHRDPAKAHVARDVLSLPLDRSRPHFMYQTLREGTPVLMPKVATDALAPLIQSEAHAALAEAVGIESYIAVPIQTGGQGGGRTLGALLLVRSEGAYDADDLLLAIELGRRTGLAVENARLYQQARQAVEARDDVLGVVSHDLGNPLQAIFIGLEAMERSRTGRSEGRPGQEEYYLTAIRRSAEVMERLIRDLLEVRRMEAGHLKLRPTLQPLHPLVAEALEILNPLARVKEIELVNEVPETGLPMAAMDGDRIQQVLSNLVGNAVKHTPEEGVVTLRAESVDGELHVHVQDSGPGLQPDELERVFDRFWRGNQAQAGESGSRNRRGIGIGLGLAIARGIVRGHGGRIWAESRPGQGSTFSFALPLTGPAAADPAIKAESPPA